MSSAANRMAAQDAIAIAKDAFLLAAERLARQPIGDRHACDPLSNIGDERRVWLRRLPKELR